MFNKILVPLDGSRLAEYALEPALSLARHGRARITLVHVETELEDILADEQLFEMAGPALASPRTPPAPRPTFTASDYLDRLIERYGNSVPLYTRIRAGDVAGTIVDMAADENIDLIVMSTHGRSGMSYLLLGSVTEKVLYAAPCPVLVVRSPDPIRHMLVTLDGSELSETVIAPACELARRFDASVTLLRVDNEFLDVDPGAVRQLNHVEPGLGERFLTSHYERIDDYLHIAARRFAAAGVNVNTISVNGNAAACILNTADELESDLIVMATHGRTGLQRWIYGSVTHKVLRQARRNMLIIRPTLAPD